MFSTLESGCLHLCIYLYMYLVCQSQVVHIYLSIYLSSILQAGCLHLSIYLSIQYARNSMSISIYLCIYPVCWRQHVSTSPTLLTVKGCVRIYRGIPAIHHHTTHRYTHYTDIQSSCNLFLYLSTWGRLIYIYISLSIYLYKVIKSNVGTICL